MILSYALRQYLAQHPELTATPVKAGLNQEVGCTYWSGTWNQTYKVIDVKHDMPIWGTVVTVLWSDGEQTTHSTSLDSTWDAKLVKNERR